MLFAYTLLNFRGINWVEPKQTGMNEVNSFSGAFSGLNTEAVQAARKKYGWNAIQEKEPSGFWHVLKGIVAEPMFVLLLLAALLYFILGEYADGMIMLVAIAFVSGISLFQETRSRNALDALKKLTQPASRVFRNGALTEIPSQEIVPGDLVLLEEGCLIPADAQVVQANDFSVNESILTGESFAVNKYAIEGSDRVYYGTLVTSGSAVAEVGAIGSATELGKIGKSLEGIATDRTPLQIQIGSFVRTMAGVGVLAFLVVWGINYWKSGDILFGLLNGLTLAMSVLPEEIPVAFATFMALGAWKLIKNGVLTKEPQTVESLGSATVICFDKTGTITENRMRLAEVYCFASGEHKTLEACTEESFKRVIAYAMWSSEVRPFDPMETAIHEAYAQTAAIDQRPLFGMVHEYPLQGTPPAMTHVYENGHSEQIVAAKGGWETILAYAGLSETEVGVIAAEATRMARRGYRVLGVASSTWEGKHYPDTQGGFLWQFEGLIALEDPARPNMEQVFARFYDAGIQLKIVSGDYLDTVQAIAHQTGFREGGTPLTGTQVMAMDAATLQSAVEQTHLFARMFPEAKLRIIEALKANGEVVAMTGDGVNDAPALKAAHIGVAMGANGAETAKRAASMVILDDDLDKMGHAIFLGRRIYSNFKKAVRYIVSIHIPIILTVGIPLLLGWRYANLFSPVHVIFFELIMGPTCSIIFENEPMEARLLREKPRKLAADLFTSSELMLSLLQGLMITGGVLFLYKTAMDAGRSVEEVRSIAFSTILFSNVFLTLVNRSFFYGVWETIRYPNRLIPVIILVTLLVLIVVLYLPAAQHLFGLAPLKAGALWQSAAVAAASVFWIEGYKLIRFHHSNS